MSSHTEQIDDRRQTGKTVAGQSRGSGAAAWDAVKPWQGKAEPMDRFLLLAPLVAVGLMLLTKPLQPFWLASEPLLLAAVTGSNLSVGAAAAFAAVNGTSLLPVIAVGVFGSLKFHWLFWLAGRRWGDRLVALLVPTESGQRKAAGLRGRTRLTAVGVLIGEWPGVPTVLVHVIAGWQQMSFLRWCALAVIGAAAWVGLVAGLGYGIGQPAVDLVLMIDRYATWVSLGILVLMLFTASRQARRTR
ncbi:DedA family protein [Naumannella halotolerans]|uniref:Membrane protein DedA with SNARE-associated domain n=1 Tax=Naumannella halotolerans TaxID=993414 RepID=A0A4R7J893_9ACTN|nr:DedA family protein [Naumannella halotolerans]TDT32579.1 membrane protein DedA with SNARE-associated domain [Naumannella halotolerans]